MTLAELADALDVPARQIRFLIAEGVLPPAVDFHEELTRDFH